MLDENQPGTVAGDGEGSPKRRGRKPRKDNAPELDTGKLLELFFQKFSEMSEQNQQNMMAAIQEMKKPSVREQQLIDKEEAQLKRKMEGRIQAAKIEEERAEALRKGCSHQMPSSIPGVPGRHAWVAAVNSDGWVRPFCNICKYGKNGELKFKATQHMLQNGVGLNAIPSITLDRLEEWAKQQNSQLEQAS